MKPIDFLRATQGLPLDGATLLFRIDDPLRKAVAYRYGDDLIVGFGGTRGNFFDWLLNFWAWPIHFDVAGSSLRAHPGALVEAKTVLPSIFAVISGIRRFLLSGHSQGGAQAVDVALEIAGHWPNLPIEVVTFGAMPALTTSSACAVTSMATFHQIQFTNYVLSGDPMGIIPWKALGLSTPGVTVYLDPGQTWPDGRRHSPSAYLKALEGPSKGL